MKFTWKLALLFLLPFSFVIAHSQQTGITGVVTDSQGATIQNAKVEAKQPGGASFAATTNDHGVYVIPNIAAEEYTVTVSAPNFATAEKKILVLVGQLAQEDFTLPVATGSTEVVVEAGSDLAIDTTASEVAGNITPQEVQDIPVNGRSYVELSELVPGIKNNAFGNAPVSGPGGASEGDAETGKFQITLDGLQLSQDSVGSSFGQPKVSQDAISQFQIITNRFDATAGRSAGVYVNVQTKTGTNEMHGGAFGYFRNSFFNARDPITGTVLPFADEQYGGTLGGPIKRDKLWYFGSFEGEHQPSTASENPIILSTPGVTTNTSGVGIYTHPVIFTNYDYLGRADYQVGANNHLFLRGDGFKQDTSFVAQSNEPSQSYFSTVTAAGYVFDWDRNISSNLINDAHAGFHYFQFGNFPFFSDNSIVLTLPAVTVGEPYNEPEVFNQYTQQYRDDLFWLKGKHAIKMGGEYLHTLHGGSFPQYLRGGLTTCSPVAGNTPDYATMFPSGTLDPSTWNYTAINNYCNASESYTQAFGNYNIDITRNIIGLWIEDDWKLLPRLTLNLGLRYDNDLGAYNTSYAPSPGLITPNSNPNLNFAPRIGFAWDPFGDGKTSIHGGGGIYYADQVANAIIDEELYSSTARALQATTSGTDLALPAPFAGQNPSSDPQNYVTSPQPVQRGAKTPYAFQASFGISRQLPGQTTITIDGFHQRVYDDWIALGGNLLVNPANPEQNLNPATNMTATIYGERVCGNGGIDLDTLDTTMLATDAPPNGHTTGQPAKQVCNQTFGAAVRNFAVYPGAGDINDNLAVGIRHAITHGFTGAIAYTWGRDKNSTNGAFGYPNKPFKSGIQQEWANGTDDQRQTLTATGQYAWKYGLMLSSLYHFGSGLAFAPSSGTSVNGYSSSTRTFAAGATPEAPGFTGTCPTTTCTKIYAPLSKTYYDPAYGYYIIQRDGFRGTPYNRVDARLQETIKLHERYSTILGFEAFNLFNHSNYGNFNTTATLAVYGHPNAVSSEGSALEYFGRNLQFFGRFAF
ncbi:MAG: carboxypeptidase regulatory-like domain-containing protein [Terracidiphilus sp.]